MSDKPTGRYGRREPRAPLSNPNYIFRAAVTVGMLTLGGLVVADHFADRSGETIATQGEGVRQEVAQQSEELRDQLKELIEKEGQDLEGKVDERIDEFVAGVTGDAEAVEKAMVTEHWKSISDLL